MVRTLGVLALAPMSACATAQPVDYGDDKPKGHHRDAPAPDNIPPPATPPAPSNAATAVPPLAAGRVIKQCHLIEGHVRHCEEEAYTGKAPAPSQGSWRICDIDRGNIGICLTPIEGNAIVEQDGVVRECELIAGIPVNCMDPGFSGDAPVPAPL